MEKPEQEFPNPQPAQPYFATSSKASLPDEQGDRFVSLLGHLARKLFPFAKASIAYLAYNAHETADPCLVTKPPGALNLGSLSTIR